MDWPLSTWPTPGRTDAPEPVENRHGTPWLWKGFTGCAFRWLENGQALSALEHCTFNPARGTIATGFVNSPHFGMGEPDIEYIKDFMLERTDFEGRPMLRKFSPVVAKNDNGWWEFIWLPGLNRSPPGTQGFHATPWAAIWNILQWDTVFPSEAGVPGLETTGGGG